MLLFLSNFKDSRVVARYFGESGRSGYLRSGNHRSEIEKGLDSNGFAKHLEIHHPDHTRDPSHLKLKVIKTFRKSLERQACEATKISHNDADIPMNSRSEFHQPSISRVTVMRGLGS